MTVACTENDGSLYVPVRKSMIPHDTSCHLPLLLRREGRARGALRKDSAPPRPENPPPLELCTAPSTFAAVLNVATVAGAHDACHYPVDGPGRSVRKG